MLIGTLPHLPCLFPKIFFLSPKRIPTEKMKTLSPFPKSLPPKKCCATDFPPILFLPIKPIKVVGNPIGGVVKHCVLQFEGGAKSAAKVWEIGAEENNPGPPPTSRMMGDSPHAKVGLIFTYEFLFGILTLPSCAPTLPNGASRMPFFCSEKPEKVVGYERALLNLVWGLRCGPPPP